MLQLQKNLYEIQEQIDLLVPYVDKILNRYSSHNIILYHSTDGTQYIDTQVTPTLGTKLELEFAPTSLDNSFIAGSDKFAILIHNGIYVFVVGNMLYTTGIEAEIDRIETITLTRNGLNIRDKVFTTVGNDTSFIDDTNILICAGYNNTRLLAFSTLNAIDDTVDEEDFNDIIDEQNLMTTLNSIDNVVSEYEGDILNNYGISAEAGKKLYSFKVSYLNDQNIREYIFNAVPSIQKIDNNEVCGYFNYIDNQFYRSGSDTDFIEGAIGEVEGIAYSVKPIEGATYGFVLNKDGYYESTNQGVHSSYAICRLVIEVPEAKNTMQIDCINWAESGCDYGIFSKLDTELSLSNSVDNSTLVQKSFSSSNSSDIQAVMYTDLTAGKHFIDIKYRKDGSVNSNNDSLQWKLVPVSTFTYTVTKPHSGSYTFALNSKGYYESNNKGVSNSYALCKLTFFAPRLGTLTLSCINYAESNYDFGILSNIDTTLTASSSADSTNVKKSFQGSSSSSVQTVTYTNVSAGEHYIYIKYRKDGSVNSNNDSLQFKVSYS